MINFETMQDADKSILSTNRHNHIRGNWWITQVCSIFILALSSAGHNALAQSGLNALARSRANIQVQTVPAGSFTSAGDYSAYPEMQADYTHLQLELEIDEEGRFGGEASYTFQLLRSGVDTLTLDAEGLDINSIYLSGQDLDFSMENGRLTITLPDSLTTETAYILRIVYSSSPGFGVHTDEWEMRWGSLLPGAVHHWLPVVDHPRNRFTTDVTFSFPSGYTAAFSGSPSLSGVVSVDQESIRFVSDWELPAPALTFATGIADRATLTSGRNRIHMMSRSDLLSEERMNELMALAGTALERAATHAGAAYPYRDLQIVVLDDNRWEVKNYGAGIVYAYMNAGELGQQILKGIAAQWAGVRRMEEQWSDAWGVILLQEWLTQRLSGSGSGTIPAETSVNAAEGRPTAETGPDNPYRMFAPDDSLTVPADSLHELLRMDRGREIPDGLYSEFSDPGRQRWLGWLGSGDDDSYQQVVRTILPGGLLSGAGILNWHLFAEMIYDQTGLAMFSAPYLRQPMTADNEPEEWESYFYQVEYVLNEAEGTLRLQFEAEGAFTDDLVTVTVTQYGVQEPTERSLTFTGASDEVVLSLSSAVRSVDLSVSTDSPVNVQLEQHKPFTYLIDQLRNSDLPEVRIQAAAGLRDYVDNPDLQLALLDFVGSEENLLVQAEMIRTLAAVTNGAAGTARLFLQRYDPSAPMEHRLAILEAYRNYSGNEQIITNLRQIIVNSSNPEELRLYAIAVLARVTDAGRFRAFTEEMIPIAEMTPQVPLLLMYQAAKGEVESAVQVAEALLQPGYSFDLRSGGLSLLLAFDHSMEGWEDRLPGLLTDSDPRIRYMATEGLENLAPADRNRLVADRLESEQDLRVIRRLQSF